MLTDGYLGLDIGGSGAKAGVFAPDGRLLGFGKVSYAPTMTADGGAEIPIATIYDAARVAAGIAIRASGAHVRALAIATQGQTFVSLDADDSPLHPAILWYDSRAAKQAERLAAAVNTAGAGESSLIIQSISSGPKILWLRERFPALMARARRHLLLPDYFVYRLTGMAVTDPSTAVSTGLFAPGAAGYHYTALNAAAIDKDMLARIQPEGAPIATVRPEIAAEWGLPADTLVVTGTNDQYAGALGAGNCHPGVVSETTGTCLAQVTLTTTEPVLPPGLIGGPFPIAGYFFVLAYAKTAGLALEWFNREWCPRRSLEELDALAESAPIGSNGVVVLPDFDGAFSPVPNAAARGFIGNLSLGHTQADIYRAMLESICFCSRENLALMTTCGFPADRLRAIGGGANSASWLQMKADVTGLPVERPAVTEAACLGAAMLAAVGLGDFSSLAASSASLYRTAQSFLPDAERQQQYEAPFQAYRGFRSRVSGVRG